MRDEVDRLKVGRSITSNVEKLISSHGETLEMLRQRIASPVLLHVSPTNLCNMNCIHCCFSERDKTLNLDFELLKDVVYEFSKLGIKSVEFTGGGEPTKYGQPRDKDLINRAIEYVTNLDLALGMNTNALDISSISEENWKRFSWVRVALNIFDSGDERRIRTFKKNVEQLKSKTRITACYIVPQEIGLKNLRRVIEYADSAGLATRIAPDCIQDRGNIAALTREIKGFIQQVGSENALLSDFNIYLFDREEDICMMHFLKPFLYTDGFVYTCPSSELAPENERTMQERFRIGHGSEVAEIYKNIEPRNHNCSYCKYAAQNSFLYDLWKGQTPKVAYLNQRRTQDGKGFLEKKVKEDFDKALKTKFGDSEFA